MSWRAPVITGSSVIGKGSELLDDWQRIQAIQSILVRVWEDNGERKGRQLSPLCCTFLHQLHAQIGGHHCNAREVLVDVVSVDKGCLGSIWVTEHTIAWL